MKRVGRVKLRCSKRLRRRVYDTFFVVVASGKKDAAKAEYERQGYSVRVLG